jgi:hypothetical protein
MASTAARWVCPGGRPSIVITEDDLLNPSRSGVPRRGGQEPAAEASFGPFTPTTNTVEWRAADGKSFAIIHAGTSPQQR